ncbi:2-hydroxyacid dehydrogenase [Propionivibrio dicarboxylicus]|uniref:Lactate dehydrogenase n=1 Tax=Propionivibrio dicarboxylicus TaxID=83767 RepID=A0A1G8AEG6_9RHOO|nr:2-hydroxyacid dehydrogenase [Propionivibrio dicarboxylicus]SDH18720.1 Lactate dehydrogenase [Propionivibrio dicarboxylicus]
MTATAAVKPAILQIGSLLPVLENWLDERYSVSRLDDAPDAKAFLAEQGGRFVGVATSALYGVSAEQIAAMPALKVISCFGVGVDKIDLPAARARGIAVGNTPDILNDCVADTAFALLLDIARATPEADRYVRTGLWAERGQNSFHLGRRVSGGRLGIVGLGRIGKTIARRALGFDMDIRYHTRRPVADATWPHEPSLVELARWADFLVVITAGGPGTLHLINAEVLDALGPRSFLINVSRGSVVDEPALVRALVERRIAGAGLDVFANEPFVPAELLALDNVVLLPHIASATEETRRAMAQRVIDNLDRFFADGTLITRVD